MLTQFIRVLFLACVLSACAHHGAVRVECNGPLRPINAPSQHEPPVSVEPAPVVSTPDTEKQP